jgi:hypothetical protein
MARYPHRKNRLSPTYYDIHNGLFTHNIFYFHFTNWLVKLAFSHKIMWKTLF